MWRRRDGADKSRHDCSAERNQLQRQQLLQRKQPLSPSDGWLIVNKYRHIVSKPRRHHELSILQLS